jgi:hypothetical protein
MTSPVTPLRMRPMRLRNRLGKLSNLVSELYLVETEQKEQRLWQKARKAMEKLNIPEAIINHITECQDVEILAKNLQDWLKSTKGKK